MSGCTNPGSEARWGGALCRFFARPKSLGQTGGIVNKSFVCYDMQSAALSRLPSHLVVRGFAPLVIILVENTGMDSVLYYWFYNMLRV